jgi:hypothetical protein
MDKLVFILSLMTIVTACKPTSCETASNLAITDFERGLYSFHSAEFQPVENSYLYVLRQDYNIKWYFTDSLDFYKCYDSTLITLLEKKYSKDFLTKARKVADSLDLIPDWTKPPASFNGEINELLNKVIEKLKSGDLGPNISSRLFVQLTIDSSGAAINPEIIKGGINKSVDEKTIDIIKGVLHETKWTPAYLYGRPVKSRFIILIKMDSD